MSSSNQLDSLPFVSANQEWDRIDECFTNAFSTKKIYLFGEGFCQFLVEYTYRKLLLKKIYAIDLEGVEIKLVSDETPHTLITFSQSGENKRGLIKMKECKEYGGTVIALTATEGSSYVRERSFFHCRTRRNWSRSGKSEFELFLRKFPQFN